MTNKLLRKIFGVPSTPKQAKEDQARHIEKDLAYIEKELRQLQAQVTLNRLRRKSHPNAQ